MAFFFRQRVGRVDWSEIDALDLDSCVNARDTKTLQSLLDMVTFSDITTRDLRACGKTVVGKFIRVLQFIVEYLLYTQDSYLSSAHDKSQTIEKLNQTIRVLRQEATTNAELLKWKEKEAAQLKSAFQAAQDVLYELGYGPHVASQRYSDTDQVQSFTQAVRQVMTSVSDNHNYQVDLLKDEFAQMRNHYEKQLGTCVLAQQATPTVTQQPIPAEKLREPQKYYRSMHAQTPEEFLPMPTIVATSNNIDVEYEHRIHLLQNQLRKQSRQMQNAFARTIFQAISSAHRRKVQRRFTRWERHISLIAKQELDLQLSEAHEKRQMLVRAMHKSSKAQGNVRDADINTSISVERPQMASVSVGTDTIEPTANWETPKFDPLIAALLSEQKPTGASSLIGKVLLSKDSAASLLHDIELRIQGSLANARKQQQSTETTVEILWDELKAANQPTSVVNA